MRAGPSAPVPLLELHAVTHILRQFSGKIGLLQTMWALKTIVLLKNVAPRSRSFPCSEDVCLVCAKSRAVKYLTCKHTAGWTGQPPPPPRSFGSRILPPTWRPLTAKFNIVTVSLKLPGFTRPRRLQTLSENRKTDKNPPGKSSHPHREGSAVYSGSVEYQHLTRIP